MRRDILKIKRSKTNQMGKGTTICIGRTEGRHTCPVAAMEAYIGCCCCPTHRPSSTSETGGHLRPRASAPPSNPWWSNVATTQPSTTHVYSLRIGAATAAARAGLPSDTIQKLGRWQSSAYQTYIRHPLTHPSDTRTMAAQ